MTEINPVEFTKNPFKLIGKDWMLVTSGDKNKFNTMTASWGGTGVLWNKNVVFTFIRPQRYTYEFMENNDYFTLCFFGEEHRKALSFCGKYSGRDYDKVKETNLTPLFDLNAPYFKEAKTVILCKKIYGQFLNKDSIIDNSIESCYAENDYHKMYVGEILKILEK